MGLLGDDKGESELARSSTGNNVDTVVNTGLLQELFSHVGISVKLSGLVAFFLAAVANNFWLSRIIHPAIESPISYGIQGIDHVPSRWGTAHSEQAQWLPNLAEPMSFQNQFINKDDITTLNHSLVQTKQRLGCELESADVHFRIFVWKDAMGDSVMVWVLNDEGWGYLCKGAFKEAINVLLGVSLRDSNVSKL